MKTSMFDPLALTGKVATFSGGARFPSTRGPRIGGKGHQSPTTSPAKVVKIVKENLCKYYNSNKTCLKAEGTLV